MLIYCIVADHPDWPDDPPWLITAWDEFAAEDNHEGWVEELKQARREHRGCEVRVAYLEVPDDWLSKQFRPTVTKAKPA